MSVAPSETSFKTLIEVEGSTSTTSSARRNIAEVSQLKALQAKRAADEAERAVEARRRATAAAAAAAEAEAQLTLQEARAETRKAADAPESDALELKLTEDDELGSQSLKLLAAREANREGCSPACHRQRSQVDSVANNRAAGRDSAAEWSRADSQERTERWLTELPLAGGRGRASALPKISLEEFSGSSLE